MAFSDYTTALVTGASSGIGAAVVERLSQEGIQVHALARSADKLQELATRTGCIAHAIDVTDLAGLTRLFQTQRFDILVNNAGVDRPGSILNADAAGIDLLIDVNLRAVLHLARLALPGMVARDCGHIVNISSIAAAYNFGGNSTYHATKAAVSMLSRQLRIDAFGKRVRVTEICPGRVATDIFAHVHGDSEETYKRFVEGFELPQAKDIADAIAFAIAAPIAVNVGHMEITPTLQVPGGLSTARPRITRAERCLAPGISEERPEPSSQHPRHGRAWRLVPALSPMPIGIDHEA
ncbi:Oxidoreductase, short-chain dehydrogenase/reductase family [Pseudomonas chlororaphis subsp. aureofaciens]|nr:Oxidoreductase, short-chain dehydrogenase/reductase family [Pseudomonas chlororaphis subsp. aureofaciens]